MMLHKIDLIDIVDINIILDNQDKEITNGELIAYLKTNVSREAFSQAREQDPMLVGNHNLVLMRYR